VAVVALVSAHVLLVRRHGVVPPFELDKRKGPRSLRAGAAKPTARPTGDRSADVSLLSPKDDTQPWEGGYAAV